MVWLTLSESGLFEAHNAHALLQLPFVFALIAFANLEVFISQDRGARSRWNKSLCVVIKVKMVSNFAKDHVKIFIMLPSSHKSGYLNGRYLCTSDFCTLLCKVICLTLLLFFAMSSFYSFVCPPELILLIEFGALWFFCNSVEQCYC